jgi:hypothetical protein
MVAKRRGEGADLACPPPVAPRRDDDPGREIRAACQLVSRSAAELEKGADIPDPD